MTNDAGLDDETRTQVRSSSEKVGQYEILRRIGAGGMGEVYLARDTILDRHVAIKFLSQQYAANETFRARFRREAQAVARLTHPGVVHIYEVSEHRGRPFFVMEYVEGRSLRAALAVQGFEIPAAVDLALHVLEGLREAHDAGVVHRDIKPSNVILDAKGHPKLVDFGLAMIRGKESLTESGSMLGTIGYMSPEHVEGGEVDERSDLFAVGVLLYEILARKAPFERDTRAATFNAILQSMAQPLQHHCPDVPEQLGRIVSRLLERDPGSRYQTAADAIRDLQEVRKEIEREAVGRPSDVAGDQPSIAVLPFVDMSPGRDQEYFCDGMAEELIDGLTKLSDLRVAARTSAFQFKGQGYDIGEVGRKLKVRTLLEGSVRKAGNRVRVTAQLVNVADGYHIWSEKYDRDLDDIFAIQDKIALAIVEKLRVRLLGESREGLIKRFTDDHEAYSLYLRGRYFWNKRLEVGLKKANEFFQKACEQDPSYALPYVGVADAYNILGWFGFLLPAEAFSKARAAAHRALEIDPMLGEAHASLAWVLASHDWDWPAAEAEYRRAIELNPTYATAHEWYALLLLAMGRMDEAIAEGERALELDPLSLIINAFAGVIHWFAGYHDTAIRYYNRTLEMEPRFHLTALWLATTYAEAGQYEQAIAAAEKSERVSDDALWTLGMAGWVYAVAGLRERASGLLRKLDELAQKRYVSPIHKAQIYAGLGENERALDSLEMAADLREPLLILMKRFRMWDDVRMDSRYSALIRKIGLP